MLVAIIILAWLLVNTVASMVIICIDGSTPRSASDWIGLGISCIFCPLVMIFIIRPITTLIIKIKKHKSKSFRNKDC